MAPINSSYPSRSDFSVENHDWYNALKIIIDISGMKQVQKRRNLDFYPCNNHFIGTLAQSTFLTWALNSQHGISLAYLN